MSLRWSPLLFRWHRWLGYLVALQVLAWILGGLIFAWLPFQAWVKGGEVLRKPAVSMPEGWQLQQQALPADRGALLALQAVATPAGAALKLRHAQGGESWVLAGGGPLAAPTAAEVEAFARKLYIGEGPLLGVEQIDEPPRRLGLVRELGERPGPFWRVRFDDRFQSRFYFDTRSGELLAARNEAWVLYDFFWRLHLMDYQGGEDFNNGWLRAASAAAILLVLSGLGLSGLALARAWRRARRHAAASSQG